MELLITNIRKEFKKLSNKKTQESFQRFFKEPVLCYGINTPIVNKLSKKYWQHVKYLNKKDFFSVLEELYKSDFCEEAFIVSGWASKKSENYTWSDLKIFKKWINKYINNWAKCDGFCTHTMGNFIDKYPSTIKELKKWTKSKNRWVKRAAAVSLIIPAKRGAHLKEVLEISDLLI